MTFPTLFTVGHHAYSGGVEDDYNIDTPTYTPAEDATGTSRRVYGWSVPATTEPKLAGHDRVAVDIELLCPSDFPAGPHDLIDLTTGPNQGQYEVIGEPEDLTHGPFPFTPGVVLNLRKVTG
jgi:hypothetical protein